MKNSAPYLAAIALLFELLFGYLIADMREKHTSVADQVVDCLTETDYEQLESRIVRLENASLFRVP